MANESRALLEERIESDFGELFNLDPQSKERAAMIEGIATLYKLKIEEDKIDVDFNKHNSSELIRQEQINIDYIERRKDRLVNIGLGIAGIIIPIGFYAKWMKRGFQFEKEGTFTSTTFRGLFSKFKPIK